MGWAVKVNIGMVSDIITTWAVLIDRALGIVFKNPTKSMLLRNYPERLVAAFGDAKICMLLDCCDIECEQPNFRRALATLYSTYHHQACLPPAPSRTPPKPQTVESEIAEPQMVVAQAGIKVAVGCTPYGAVPAPWCPDGYPSSVSDNKITDLTGILANNLRDGDATEADRGSANWSAVLTCHLVPLCVG